MSTGGNYSSLEEVLTANPMDPASAPPGTHLVVYRLQGGKAAIMGQGLLRAYDGNVVVFDRLPDDLDTLGGIPILGSRDDELDPDEPQTTTVQLSGCQVASGAAYKEWNDSRRRRARLEP